MLKFKNVTIYYNETMHERPYSILPDQNLLVFALDRVMSS